MIIVEGSALSGKTTFAKELARLLNLVYQDFESVPDRFDHFQGYLELASSYIVRDGFHLREPVNSMSLGHSPALTVEAARLVDAHTRMLGTITVLITVEDCELEKRFKGEPEDLQPLLRANQSFIKIGRQRIWKNYEFDIDCHIHCSKELPWPTDNLQHVINLYVERKHALERFAE